MLPWIGTKKKRKNETPIIDFLNANTEELYVNFHALPVFHMQPGNKGYCKYNESFGNKYLSLETTVTGKIFDSFFYPEKCIKKAQKYASDIFGSNDTLFVTCGTSISNQIVVDALVGECSRVLIDRELHQSMHFAVNAKRAKFDYIYNETFCELTEKKYFNIEKLINMVVEANQIDQPYNVIILNAASYDGVICNVYEVIKRIIEVTPNTNFIIDEAWSSAFYFHDELYKYTAGYAAAKFKNLVNIVATQSAHKSLMALRQGSMIHSFAEDEITEKLYRSRFKYHTTSPSYSILASIDMARSHMQAYGKELLNQALENARILREALASDELLMPFLTKEKSVDLCELSGGIFIEDPLKVHLNFKHLGMRGADFQECLYRNYGIYLNRFTETTALINIHIGIDKNHICHLLKSLKAILDVKKLNEISYFDDCDFIISYPPGIPMYAPGEKLDHKKISLDIEDKIRNGINVFQVT